MGDERTTTPLTPADYRGDGEVNPRYLYPVAVRRDVDGDVIITDTDGNWAQM